MASISPKLSSVATACEVTISSNNNPRQGRDAYVSTGHPLCDRVRILPKLSRTPWILHVAQTDER